MTTTMTDLASGRTFVFNEALPGRDAYEEALSRGFQGDRDAWLASLRAFSFDPDGLDWEADRAYVPHEAVRHAGAIWLAKADSMGIAPNTDPEKWVLLLPAGAMTPVNLVENLFDVGAGRVPTVFWMGLGNPGNAGTLLSAAGAADALRGWRIDRVAGANVALVGGPAGASGGTFMTVGYSSINQHQMYFEVTGVGRVFQRFLNAGVWSAWRVIYTAGNLLGTVTQTGGVPTGAVIQRGSNANGEFVRFADGTMICTRSIAMGSITAAGAGTYASPFRTNPATWTFPAAFAVAPSVSVLPAADVSQLRNMSTASATVISAAAATIILTRVSADTNPDLFTASCTATGRWF